MKLRFTESVVMEAAEAVVVVWVVE